MSALRHGKIERFIVAEIATYLSDGRPVGIRSDDVADGVFEPRDIPFDERWNWKPTRAQRKAVTRAMHSFVRKHQQYALMGGQGRRELFLYDTADPLSVMWTKLNVERRKGNPISLSEARAALAASLE
jgi:hypothetical protein